VEQLFVGKDSRNRSVRMVLADEVDVLTQDLFLKGARANHVVAQLQQLRLPDEGVLIAQGMERRDLPHRLIAVDEQAQDGHEVALAATKTAVQISRFAASAGQRRVNQVQAAIKGILESLGDHIGVGRALGIGHTAGQFENEVALVDLIGKVEEIFEEVSHG